MIVYQLLTWKVPDYGNNYLYAGEIDRDLVPHRVLLESETSTQLKDISERVGELEIAQDLPY